MEIKTETKIVRFIECDGLRFYEDKKGYWLGHVDGKRKRLHIYVWEKYHGKIPKGFHIHHIDHNTNNNEIENLVMLNEKDHLSLHAQIEKNKSLARKNVVKHAVPAAREWHGTAEGINWHKELYEKTLGKLHNERITLTCRVCGRKFECDACKTNTKFCSNNCKSKARRDSKVDNEERICEVCREKFITNKYSKAKTCSPKCRSKTIEKVHK